MCSWGFQASRDVTLCELVCCSRRFKAPRYLHLQELSRPRHWPQLTNIPKNLSPSAFYACSLHLQLERACIKFHCYLKWQPSLIFLYINNIPRNAASSDSISRELPRSNLDQGRAIITNVSHNFSVPRSKFGCNWPPPQRSTFSAIHYSLTSIQIVE